MNNIFSYDSKFMQALLIICDHILLNLLFIVCCIPVFTISAAQAALYSGIRVLRDQEDDSSCFRAFWMGLCSGFGKITPVWVGIALIMGVTSSCFLYLLTLEQVDPLPVVTCLIALAICMVYQSTLSLFHSKFGCTTGQLIKNVVYMIMAHPVRCIVAAVIMWMPAIVFVYAPGQFMKMTIIWAAAYYGIACGINLKIMEKPFYILSEAFEARNKSV